MGMIAFRKGNAETNPLTTSEYFIDEIKRTETMIFIGFAFRDEYINDIIRNTLMRKIIINLYATELIKKLSGNACKFKKVNAIDASFGKKDITQEI